jgi:hypothetical protein
MPGLASAEVAKAYVAAVEGSHQGRILDPHEFEGAEPPGVDPDAPDDPFDGVSGWAVPFPAAATS